MCVRVLVLFLTFVVGAGMRAHAQEINRDTLAKKAASAIVTVSTPCGYSATGYYTGRRAASGAYELIVPHHLLDPNNDGRYECGWDVRVGAYRTTVICLEPKADFVLVAVHLPPGTKVRGLALRTNPRLNEPVFLPGNPRNPLNATGVVKGRNGYLLLTDALVRPGDSGSPILDKGGRVLAIVTGTGTLKIMDDAGAVIREVSATAAVDARLLDQCLAAARGKKRLSLIGAIFSFKNR